VFGLGVENQPNGPLANFRGKLVRGLARDAPSYSKVGASGKLGAVHPKFDGKLADLRAERSLDSSFPRGCVVGGVPFGKSLL
jgi:hypothetical protein